MSDKKHTPRTIMGFRLAIQNKHFVLCTASYGKKLFFFSSQYFNISIL